MERSELVIDNRKDCLSYLVKIESLKNKQVSVNAPALLSELQDEFQPEIPTKLEIESLFLQKPTKNTTLFHQPRPSIESLERFISESAQPQAPQWTDTQAQTTDVQTLTHLFGLFRKDVLSARDKLVALNASRRTLIERRLEYIARKIANARGERFNRTLSLTEILRESFRDGDNEKQPTLAQAAWLAFTSEVALYHVLELFFLKSLDYHRWRKFETTDLAKMNFSAHSFLNQRAVGFSHDKHCWNFVRTNLYSWHFLSSRTISDVTEVLRTKELKWSDQDLLHFVTSGISELNLSHLGFAQESKLTELVMTLLEKQLSVKLVSTFQDRPLCKKVFIPSLELGSTALAILDKILSASNQSIQSNQADQAQIQRAIWTCESESLEVFWTEVLALLKTIRHTSRILAPALDLEPELTQMQKLPHVVHAVQMLGLELHNLDQLPLGGPEISKLQHGSAGLIQQLETFDVAVVTDHIDRAKSGRWMAALASQLSYWRCLIGSGTNLNWGELHLFLAMSKLKEGGTCLYVSHRVLPEGGDGEKLRRALLSQGTFEYFVELDERTYTPYRYLYVFKKNSNKQERDLSKPKFGKLQLNGLKSDYDLSALEEANSTQGEIAERGWDHLFVRGAAPLVRHLNHKFPKLFQLASVQTVSQNQSSDGRNTGSSSFFEKRVPALELLQESSSYRFGPAKCANRQPETKDAVLVFPHNPIDLPWLQCLLNANPAKFWLKQQIISNHAMKVQKAPKTPKSTVSDSLKSLRPEDLRSMPILDLTHAPSEAVNEALEWMGSAKPNELQLRDWASGAELDLVDRQVRFVSLSKRYCALEKILERYLPLFNSCDWYSERFDVQKDLPELRTDSVTKFYPQRLLCQILQSSEIRVQYNGRENSPLAANDWVLTEVTAVNTHQASGTKTHIVVHTKQGPSIQLQVPSAIGRFVHAQLEQLRDHTWGEIVDLLHVPLDISLFTAQTGEITRVMCNTVQEMKICKNILDELALDLFEISTEMRQFFEPH